MESILSAAAFSRSKCAGPTIAPTVQYALYQSVWQPGWTCQHNQPNHADHCTLFESPPHMLGPQEIISIVECSWTSQIRWISFFRWVGAAEIGGSDLVESGSSMIHEEKENGHGRYHWGHCPYNRPKCYEIREWSHCWHRYILPCNQVPEPELM